MGNGTICLMIPFLERDVFEQVYQHMVCLLDFYCS